MQLDFWNNPLVVTAMRLKYRRGSPGIWAVMWVLALLGVGALLHHLSQLPNGFRFPTAFLIAILSLQCLVSAVIAVITASSSMNSEVVNRTLDFQRIVTLSPRAILVGKMIGEPALSYFLMIASMPLAAICWGLGAASGAVIFWLYVNLATFTLMWAALGLINSLTPPTQSAGRQKSSGGGAGFAILFAVVPQLLIHGRNSLQTPGVGDVIQMLSPAGSLIHLWEDNAWNSRIAFWGASFPSLLVAPMVQLGIAAWIVAAMSRRLKNSLNPLASKPRSYATLAAVDLVIAGICYSQWQNGVDATKLVYGYGLAHIIACLILVFATVPRRAAIISWIWRRDPKRSQLRELIAADRSPMTLAAFLYAGIGLAVMMIALVGPMSLTAAAGRSEISATDLGEVCLLTATLVASMTLLHQLFASTTSRGGHMLFILFVVLANLLPPVTAATLRVAAERPSETFLDVLTSLSPAALFSLNLARVASPPGGAEWLIAAYGALAVLSFVLLRRILRREAGVVRTKLQTMGLAPAA